MNDKNSTNDQSDLHPYIVNKIQDEDVLSEDNCKTLVDFLYAVTAIIIVVMLVMLISYIWLLVKYTKITSGITLASLLVTISVYMMRHYSLEHLEKVSMKTAMKNVWKYLANKFNQILASLSGRN